MYSDLIKCKINIAVHGEVTVNYPVFLQTFLSCSFYVAFNWRTVGAVHRMLLH